MTDEITRDKVRIALRESREHWERMVAFVEERAWTDSDVSYIYMREVLGEDWTGRYCALCKYCLSKSRVSCDECPLGKKHGHCSPLKSIKKLPVLPVENPWLRAHTASTWREWLDAARDMVDVLSELEDDYHEAGVDVDY